MSWNHWYLKDETATEHKRAAWGSLHVCEFTEVNARLCSSSGLIWFAVILLLFSFRLVAVGVVVKQGDWRDFTPAHQPSRSDGCAELHDTGHTQVRG